MYGGLFRGSVPLVGKIMSADTAYNTEVLSISPLHEVYSNPDATRTKTTNQCLSARQTHSLGSGGQKPEISVKELKPQCCQD